MDIGVSDGVLTEVHVERLRPFNASRTSIDALLSHNLDSSYGIVSAILSHRTSASGALEFEVKWQDSTTSFVDVKTLSKVTLFKDYVTQHGLTLAPSRTDSSRSGRGRPRGR